MVMGTACEVKFFCEGKVEMFSWDICTVRDNVCNNISQSNDPSSYVTGFGKTDHNVTFCISRNTVLKH